MDELASHGIPFNEHTGADDDEKHEKTLLLLLELLSRNPKVLAVEFLVRVLGLLLSLASLVILIPLLDPDRLPAPDEDDDIMYSPAFICLAVLRCAAYTLSLLISLPSIVVMRSLLAYDGRVVIVYKSPDGTLEWLSQCIQLTVVVFNQIASRKSGIRVSSGTIPILVQSSGIADIVAAFCTLLSLPFQILDFWWFWIDFVVFLGFGFSVGQRLARSSLWLSIGSSEPLDPLVGERPKAEISAGMVLTVSTFDGGESAVTVLSSVPLASGASGKIIPGRMLEGLEPVDIALKMYNAQLTKVERKLLRRELLTCSQLLHPYILPFIGTASFDSCTILVAPLMHNGDLFSYLFRHPDSNRSRLVYQVGEAVRFLHDEAGFVHGDLKCENVLVSDQGDALLADFGLSTTVTKAKFERTTSTAINHKHTLQFAAPEILIGYDLVEDDETYAAMQQKLRSKTPASDVWAFGMLVLQLEAQAFSGRPPWHGLTDAQVIRRVGEDKKPPRPSDDTANGLTDAHWSLCQKCWKLSPRERPRTREVVDDLTVLAANDDHSSGVIL